MKSILAFDLGTSCGWARTIGDVYVYGTLNLKPGRFSGGGMRFVRFEQELVDLTSEQARPDLIVYEEVRMHMGVDAAHIYGGLQAILTARCERIGVPYEGIHYATIKKHATTKGNANKKAMVAAALRILNRDVRVKIGEDEADAICLLDYAVKTYGGKVGVGA